MDEYEPISSSVKWFDKDLDKWIYCDRNSRTYSSALMLATHFWNGEAWVKYDED